MLAEAEIDGVRLHGRISDLWPQGMARLRFGRPNGPGVIRHGLDWLLASAAQLDRPLVEFHDAGEEAGMGPHIRAPLPPAQAVAALRRLLQLREQGLRTPLPFAPYSGWAYLQAKSPGSGVKAARQAWHGSDHRWAEGDADAPRLALRGCDPFADAGQLRRFLQTTLAVFRAVESGLVDDPPLPESLDRLLAESAADATEDGS